MSPKFQKRSALKFARRIIPEAQRSGIIETLSEANGDSGQARSAANGDLGQA